MPSSTWQRLSALSVVAVAATALALAVPASAKSPILHRVSAGGPDACIALGADHPGCNANYSLNAIQNADGSVKGEYTDQFGNGDGGFHAQVDCLSVVGNTAWIGGIVTNGTWGGTDITGRRVVTRVQDNGNSANDPPDNISYSYLVADTFSCTTNFSSPWLAAPQGQVKVS